MANKKIQDVQGIGPKFGEALAGIGITTSDGLLEAGATRPGRKKIAEATGVDEKRVLKWVNMCDLFRVNGIAGQYAELLEGAGVDTVKELRTRNAENLTQKLAEVNAAKKLVRQVPAASMVTRWIEEAKSLPPVVTH